MGLIDGQSPAAERVDVPVRIVVKLAEAVTGDGRGTSLEVGSSALPALRDVAPEVEFTSYFEPDERQLRAATQSPFNRYLAAELSDEDAAQALVRILLDLDLVDDAYVEGGPVPPPVNPGDDPRSPQQGYLDAAPRGIDARWAWSLTNGWGVTFVDLERGWTLDHEDLATARISVISGLNQDFHGHGTGVLGEVLSVDNNRGGIGIAPGATGRVVSQWRTSTNYNTAAAILSAGQSMSDGDVLLLEAQTSFNGLGNLPVEVETAVFDAIRHVTDDGIVVVEAAGNGGHDLDTVVDTANRRILDPDSPHFRDSGAVMVGAASSSVPHGRLSFSCHGGRIDCYGWGEDIDTTGDGWQGTSTTSYTSGFGGTSGASPIVAGAAVLLQSWRRRREGRVYGPDVMRSLLSSVRTNTPSANPGTDRIGVMPDLRAIVEAQVGNPFQIASEKYVQYVYILLGLINDAPGVVWVPGKGPVPVDPGWGSYATAIPGAKRDLLTALAVNEIAGLTTDSGSRDQLVDASLDAMRAAVERIGQRR